MYSIKLVRQTKAKEVENDECLRLRVNETVVVRERKESERKEKKKKKKSDIINNIS